MSFNVHSLAPKTWLDEFEQCGGQLSITQAGADAAYCTLYGNSPSNQLRMAKMLQDISEEELTLIARHRQTLATVKRSVTPIIVRMHRAGKISDDHALACIRYRNAYELSGIEGHSASSQWNPNSTIRRGAVEAGSVMFLRARSSPRREMHTAPPGTLCQRSTSDFSRRSC